MSIPALIRESSSMVAAAVAPPREWPNMPTRLSVQRAAQAVGKLAVVGVGVVAVVDRGQLVQHEPGVLVPLDDIAGELLVGRVLR
jgi:hypothetical protein